MLGVRVQSDQIFIGRHFSVSFQRTLRIPDDGRTYPLPPGLGRFPVRRVSDYRERVPESWREHGGVFIPMYQREALWLSFSGEDWRPNAVKVGIGRINALSAKPWNQALSGEEQDYMVVPEQPWLDGINAGNGFIRQFVAMPLGRGYTVEGQLTGKEDAGGIQLVVYDPKRGRFPDERSRLIAEQSGVCYCLKSVPVGAEMGLGVGGRMRQKIYPDPHGLETWDESSYGRVYVHIVNSLVYRQITGKEPPPTPVTAKEYAQAGLPWFDLYDEGKGDLEAPSAFGSIKSVKEADEAKGFKPQQDDGSLEDVPVVQLHHGTGAIEDGSW